MKNNFVLQRERVQSALPHALIILSAYTNLQSKADAAAFFEQESNFWWLTGIEEPDWKLVFETESGRATLIAPDIDPVHRTFDGGMSFETARLVSGADQVIDHAAGEALIKRLSNTYNTVHTLGDDPLSGHYSFVENPAPAKLHSTLTDVFSQISDCRFDLAKLRAIKQLYEIDAIKAAIALTATSFEDVKKMLPDLKTEYAVEAEFTYRFRKNNAHHAYEPIVAGAANAVTLHYGKNEMPLLDQSLLLLDIGAQLQGYPADITRTYAIGTPTKRQVEVHAAVEAAHRQIIELLGPGVSVAAYHEQVDDIMKKALASLGLLNQDTDYRKYFPHSISHGLGVDVHDALGRPTEFLAGMILTVEPGIYIPEEGIGVRIEDDILITDTGYENLSAQLSTSLY